MSSTVDPYDLQNEALQERILDIIRGSEYPDTSVREITDELSNRNYATVRKHVRELREAGEVEVTRQVGPAKLYRVVEDDE